GAGIVAPEVAIVDPTLPAHGDFSNQMEVAHGTVSRTHREWQAGRFDPGSHRALEHFEGLPLEADADSNDVVRVLTPASASSPAVLGFWRIGWRWGKRGQCDGFGRPFDGGRRSSLGWRGRVLGCGE